jgi:spore coat-associated protein N
MFKRPKRTLGALAAALLAVGVAVGTGANFTAQTANPSNTFTSGSLTMSNSQNNAAILSASNMVPGSTTNGTVDIANTGNVPGTFSLSRPNLNDTPSSPGLSNKLDLVVTDCGLVASANCGTGTVKYTGNLNAMTGSSALGTFAPNEAHRYQFVVTLASNANDTYQGASSTATFQWDAASL